MNESVLLAVISQAATAIKRVRTTLLVSVFGSVFVFICVYNTFSWGWMASSQEYNGILKNWCDQKKMMKEGFPIAERPDLIVLYSRFQANYLQDSNCCKNFLTIYHATSEKSYLSRKFINIPFTNIIFDINDLGLFSGLFFSLVMLILWYNLGLKYANVFTALKFIDNFDAKYSKKNYFDLLSMSQIITIPEESNKAESFDILVYIPYLLFSFPLLTYLIIFINDICTLKRVTEMSVYMTISSLILEGVMLVIIGLLVIGCINLDKKTDKLWDIYEKLFIAKDEQSKR